MKDLLGKEIAPEVRAILYLAKYTHEPPRLEVTHAIHFEDVALGFQYYAEIPNPESQLAAAKDGTRESLEKELTTLHAAVVNKNWLKALGECL